MKALQCRRVEVSEWCPICHLEPEDEFHALVSCPFIRNMWCLTSTGNNIASLTSIVEWWNFVVQQREQKDVEIATTIMWYIWQNRKEVVWKGRCKQVTVIFQSALNLLSQWQIANQKSASHHLSPRQQMDVRWEKPPDNFLKCNGDAAVFEGCPHFFYGCIIRNSHGIVIVAMHGKLSGSYTLALAEAMGIGEALCWLKSLRLSHVIVESDALLVIEAINMSEPDSSPSGLIVEDCNILALNVPSCNFVFVKISANQAAHTLDREAVSMSGPVGWVSPTATLISDVIVHDLV